MQIRKDIPSKMYHYTSLESLCSIVENQEFWLGDTRQMNDYNEALERLNILNSLLNEDADLRDDPQCRDVILSINRNTLLKTPIYVACFTKLADDAAQWERYANNAAGVAIEFDVAKFERAMQFNSQMLRCITYIQGDVVKEEIAHSDMYRQAKEYILSDNKGKNPFYAITVASYALWFKNKGFEQENEIRFPRLLIRKHEKVSKINVFKGREHGTKSKNLILTGTKGADVKISALFLSPRHRQPPYGVFSYPCLYPPEKCIN